MAKNYDFWYNAVATDAQLDAGGGLNSKGQPKGPSVVVKLRIVEGEKAGQTRTTFLQLVGGATQYSIEKLRALGWTGSDLSNLMGEGVGSVKVRIGCCVEQKADGKCFESVEYIGAIGERKPLVKSPADASQVAQLNAIFADMIKQVPVVARSEANAAPAELPAEKAATADRVGGVQGLKSADSDMPF